MNGTQKIDGRSTRKPDTYAFKDISGTRYSHLVASGCVGINKHGNKLWLCRCDCGREKIFPQGKLVSGRATNCGCLTSEMRSMAASKHGITAGGRPRTLTIWCGMKARCFNPKATTFNAYGGRGITVCAEWMCFENFHRWAMANGYADGLTIDRIDNDGNYEPSNCRWIEATPNKKMQRKARYISVNGITKNVSDWCKWIGVSKTIAYKYLHQSDDAFVAFVNAFLGA